MGRPHPRRALIPTLTIRLLLLSLALLATPAAAEPLRVLTQNLNRLFDDVDNGNREKVLSSRRFQQRVKTAAKKFGGYYGLPHIIALQEVENQNVLSRIAAEIEKHYRVRYRVILIPGRDLSGINLGFMLRHGVKIKQVEQLFRDRGFGAEDHPLFTRPPLYLEACFVENCLVLLNLHLRSMRGIDSASDGERVRRKRLAQAEALAGWIDRRQKSRPRDSLLVLGDFNALTPSDAHVDVAGIIRGNPDNRSARVDGRDLVDPDMVDLTRMIPEKKRYSYVFRRQKKQLDYMYVNRAFAAEVEHIAYGRLDSRLSDHAGLIAWFSW